MIVAKFYSTLSSTYSSPYLTLLIPYRVALQLFIFLAFLLFFHSIAGCALGGPFSLIMTPI